MVQKTISTDTFFFLFCNPICRALVGVDIVCVLLCGLFLSDSWENIYFRAFILSYFLLEYD